MPMEELRGGTSSSAGTPTYYIFAGGQRVASLESSVYTYYHQDHLGGTALATDSTGTVVQLYDYYPYGSELLDSQPTGTSVPSEHSFTDKELDDDLGLYYFEARWYDSSIGRFSSQDPAQWNQVENFLADPQQLNFYTYSRNNPIVLIDPSGEVAFAAIPAYYLYLAVAALLAGATVNATIQLQDIPTPTVFDNTPPSIEQDSTYITPIAEGIGNVTTEFPNYTEQSGPYITVPSDPLNHVYNFGVGDIHAKANYIGKVSGGSQWYVEGGTTQAKNDFWNTVGDRETTTNYNEKYGENVITATLENGDSISLREFSSGESTTTVQVNHTDGTKDKYRYND